MIRKCCDGKKLNGLIKKLNKILVKKIVDGNTFGMKLKNLNSDKTKKFKLLLISKTQNVTKLKN